MRDRNEVVSGSQRVSTRAQALAAAAGVASGQAASSTLYGAGKFWWRPGQPFALFPGFVGLPGGVTAKYWGTLTTGVMPDGRPRVDFTPGGSDYIVPETGLYFTSGLLFGRWGNDTRFYGGVMLRAGDAVYVPAGQWPASLVFLSAFDPFPSSMFQ